MTVMKRSEATSFVCNSMRLLKMQTVRLSRYERKRRRRRANREKPSETIITFI